MPNDLSVDGVTIDNPTQPLAEHHRTNLETLQRAFADGNTALVACTDKATGEQRAVICAVQRDPATDDLAFIPFAKLFDGNPYDEVDPPA